MLKPHIVVLGAGFGGTYVAKKLAAQVKRGLIDVTIVNQTNYFLFTPLLHEVATGSLTPVSVAEPLREVFVNTGIELCQGSVQSIDMAERRVHITGTADGSVHHTLPYDYLVIATGAKTNYYDIPGAERYTLPLKNLYDAVIIRSHIIDSFEEAIMTEDPAERARLLTFVVVGGGPTGVETAAELCEFVHSIIDRYYKTTHLCEHGDVQVKLIHTGPELLQQFSPVLRTAAEERLRSKGVELVLSSLVTNVTSQGLTLSGQPIKNIPSATIIWAAGVKPIIPDFGIVMPPMNGGRVVVDDFFRVNGDERVFALGDIAAYRTPALPMLAQVSVKEAVVVAKNILASIAQKPLTSFEYNSQGNMVSVGQWFAVGDIFSKQFSGRLTWWLWRTTYLFKFASWKKRIRIALEWTAHLFMVRDITKLN